MKRPPEKKVAQRTEPVILFGVGDYVFAIAAAAVEEIRNTEGLQEIGIASDLLVPKVKYKLKREGRSYYVVDANLYFRMIPSHATRVLVLRNSKVALLVSHIDRMAEMGNVLALPHAFRGDERCWYRGLTVFDPAGEMPTVVPVVKADAFLTESELRAVEAGEPRKKLEAQ